MKRYLPFALLLVLCFSDSIFRKVMLQSPQAVCLDGSPGAFYISEGFGDMRNKMMIYFQGGGWCGAGDLASTLESCYQRSLTDLGSSKKLPNSLDFTDGGVLSGNSTTNPEFYSWTRVFVSYCDGSGHQGYKNASVSYKGANLFFRGQALTHEVFRSLDQSHRLWTQVEDIVVTGGSAGGLAAFHWTEYVRQNARGKVWGVPDSGVFLDSANVKSGKNEYRDQFINLMKLSNADVDPPVPGCNTAYPDEKWRCMFAQYLYPHIKAPILPINSLYDTWSIPNILGIHCIDLTGSLKGCSDADRHTIEDYKKNSTIVLAEIGGLQGNGAWGISCAEHGYLHYNAVYNPRFTVPEGSDYTIEFSIASWLIGYKQNVHIDTVSWPDHKSCAGNVTRNHLSIMI